MPCTIYVTTLRSFNVTILRSFHVTTLRSTHVTTLHSIYVTARRRIHVTTRRINYVAELRSMDVTTLRGPYAPYLPRLHVIRLPQLSVPNPRCRYVPPHRAWNVARLRKIYVLVPRWRNVALLCRCDVTWDVIWTVLVLSPLLSVCRPTAWASTPVLRCTIYFLTGTKMYQWSIVERGTYAIGQAVGRQTASSGESTRTVQNHMASRTAETTFVRIRRTAGSLRIVALHKGRYRETELSS